MKIGTQRVRKVFEPLTTTSSLVVQGGQTLMQTYSVDGTYTPDRTTTPLVVYPSVSAMTTDNSWVNGNQNQNIANMAWYVNGEVISDAWSSADYELITTGDLRGALKIKKNLASGKKVALHFECTISDTRRAINVQMKTDEVFLSTVDKSEDDWALEIDTANIINYSPFDDKLLLHDYKIAHGMESVAPTSYAGTYRCEINVTARKGRTVVTDGYTLKLCRVNANGTLGTSSVVDNELTLDLRVIDTANFLITCISDAGNMEVARKQFSVKRVVKYPNLSQRELPDFNDSDEFMHSKLIAMYKGEELDCAGLHIRAEWISSTSAQPNMKHNMGINGKIDLAKAQVGNTPETSQLAIDCDIEWKGAYKYLVDENGNYITLADGTKLINN